MWPIDYMPLLVIVIYCHTIGKQFSSQCDNNIAILYERSMSVTRLATDAKVSRLFLCYCEGLQLVGTFFQCFIDLKVPCR